METVPFSKWLEMDIKTAKIMEVEDIEGKDKLYKLTVEVGDEKRTLVAGIKGDYSKEELKGKTIIVLANLEPKKFGEIEGQGMLLAAEDSGKPILLTTDREAKSGLKVL